MKALDGDHIIQLILIWLTVSLSHVYFKFSIQNIMVTGLLLCSLVVYSNQTNRKSEQINQKERVGHIAK